MIGHVSDDLDELELKIAISLIDSSKQLLRCEWATFLISVIIDYLN